MVRGARGCGRDRRLGRRREDDPARDLVARHAFGLGLERTVDAVTERRARDGLLIPDEIAKNYVWLHHQHRSAWTHELDLRPWCETW